MSEPSSPKWIPHRQIRLYLLAEKRKDHRNITLSQDPADVAVPSNWKRIKEQDPETPIILFFILWWRLLLSFPNAFFLFCVQVASMPDNMCRHLLRLLLVLLQPWIVEAWIVPQPRQNVWATLGDVLQWDHLCLSVASADDPMLTCLVGVPLSLDQYPFTTLDPCKQCKPKPSAWISRHSSLLTILWFCGPQEIL